MKTPLNSVPDQGYTNDLPSLTVPDQSLTLRELLTNYTRGQELPTDKTPAFFDENEFIPDIKKMDLVDIQEMMEGNAQKASNLKKNLSELQKPIPIPPIKKEGGDHSA